MSCSICGTANVRFGDVMYEQLLRFVGRQCNIEAMEACCAICFHQVVNNCYRPEDLQGCTRCRVITVCPYDGLCGSCSSVRGQWCYLSNHYVPEIISDPDISTPILSMRDSGYRYTWGDGICAQCIARVTCLTCRTTDHSNAVHDQFRCTLAMGRLDSSLDYIHVPTNWICARCDHLLTARPVYTTPFSAVKYWCM